MRLKSQHVSVRTVALAGFPGVRSCLSFQPCRASLPSVDSAAILLLSNPVAEQYLTVEDGPLSPPGFRQQSSVAEHFLAVEDGFVSLPSILSQSSVHVQF